MSSPQHTNQGGRGGGGPLSAYWQIISIFWRLSIYFSDPIFQRKHKRCTKHSSSSYSSSSYSSSDVHWLQHCVTQRRRRVCSLKTRYIIRFRCSFSCGSFVLIPLLPVQTLRTPRLFTSLPKIIFQVGCSFIVFSLCVFDTWRRVLSREFPRGKTYATDVLRVDVKSTAIHVVLWTFLPSRKIVFWKTLKNTNTIHNKNNTSRYVSQCYNEVNIFVIMNLKKKKKG